VYLEAAADLARRTGDFALGYYGKELSIEIKQDGTPVTIADRGAEQFAREWIAERFPADGMLGEELGPVRAGARRRWIVDPIDGTKAFVRGVPLWGTLVSVVEGEGEQAVVLAGAAYFPGVSESLAAAPGAGCWWNGRRTHVSDTGSLAAALVVTTDDRFPGRPERRVAWSAVADRAGIARTWGDCFGYLLLATGRADVMVDDIVSPWDATAFYPIIREAGGIFSDWRGVETAFGGDVIATNSAIGETVRSMLVAR